jgi:hypothetical protein
VDVPQNGGKLVEQIEHGRNVQFGGALILTGGYRWTSEDLQVDVRSAESRS